VGAGDSYLERPCQGRSVVYGLHPITSQSFLSIISPQPAQPSPILVAHDEAHHAKW